MRDCGKFNLSPKFPKRIRLLITILFLSISFVANPWFWRLCQGDRPSFHFNLIFITAPEDIHQINTRRSYYTNQLLGRVFENKLFFYLDKYKRNFFQGLDLNYYFFANHPRERPGVAEKEILFWFWLPLFLAGFVTSLKKSLLLPGFLFLLALSVISVFSQFDHFVILLPVFLTFYIYLGLKTLILK